MTPSGGFHRLGLRPGLEQVLRCPACLGDLVEDGSALLCQACGATLPVRGGVPFAFLPTEQDHFLRLDDRLQRRARPDGPSSRRGGRYHWQAYGFEHEVPRVANGRALLHGCGDAGEREPLEGRGYEVVGFDVKRTGGTDFLADAHCLPLADESFDLVLSTQVFEHLAAPWEAASEINRVLKPGGFLVGSVAFLKPFHDSYFHISHLGMVQLLEPAGLIVERLRGAQSLTYSMYGGLIPVGSRPLRRAVLGGVDWMLMKTREMLWSALRRHSSGTATDVFDERFRFSFRDFDRLRFAPAVVFRARKPTAEVARERRARRRSAQRGRSASERRAVTGSVDSA